jgi:hypothetical protein
MNVGNAIYNLLANDATVSGFVGVQIYPAEIPQAVEMPAIIYSINGIEPETTKDGPSKLDTYTIEIVAFSNKYDEMIDIYQAIRDKIDRYTGTVASINIDQINFTGFDREYSKEARIHMGIANYSVRIKI